jgi:peptide/nickel transport system permease protein
VGRFILRRLAQAGVTVFGVMLLTFVLFRVVRGDVSANYVNPTLGPEARQNWLRKHGLDRPMHEQFLHHLAGSVTFQGRSYQTDERLTEIIAKRAHISLSLTAPALAIGWVTAMVISCMVAYYHDRWPDRIGVLLSVLGMCVPYLAYMILGQWLMFQIHPPGAWGLGHRANIYVPVAIAVLAGLGGSVRFYRTIILDQIHSDYVRTARAKGAPIGDILFKHVLKNCMLPILTNLVTAIPFLILGSLLLENFFGLPGLGDLMISSVNNSDVPIMAGLVFLTSVIYVLGLLATDLLYAVFDPRIRLG